MNKMRLFGSSGKPRNIKPAVFCGDSDINYSVLTKYDRFLMFVEDEVDVAQE